MEVARSPSRRAALGLRFFKQVFVAVNVHRLDADDGKETQGLFGRAGRFGGEQDQVLVAVWNRQHVAEQFERSDDGVVHRLGAVMLGLCSQIPAGPRSVADG